MRVSALIIGLLMLLDTGCQKDGTETLTRLSGTWKGTRKAVYTGSDNCSSPTDATIKMTWTVSDDGSMTVYEDISYGSFTEIGRPWFGKVTSSLDVSISGINLYCTGSANGKTELVGKIVENGLSLNWKGTGSLEYCPPSCLFDITYDLAKQN